MMANVCENISVNNLVTFIQILGGIEMKIFTSKCNVHNMESPIEPIRKYIEPIRVMVSLCILLMNY